MIFISCSFDPFSMPYGENAAQLFQQYGVDAYIAKHPEAGSLPNILKSKVRESEAVVALVTDNESLWQQSEITWAEQFGKPVFGIVQRGVNVRGLLPYITKYETFYPSDPDTLQSAINKIVRSIALKREENQQKVITTVVVAGLAFLGLYLLSKK